MIFNGKTLQNKKLNVASDYYQRCDLTFGEYMVRTFESSSLQSALFHFLETNLMILLQNLKISSGPVESAKFGLALQRKRASRSARSKPLQYHYGTGGGRASATKPGRCCSTGQIEAILGLLGDRGTHGGFDRKVTRTRRGAA